MAACDRRQTAVAKFWSANTVRQYNRVAREIAASRGLGLSDTARLGAMINLVGADALMSVFDAKYHYLFWRPVTAIDPTADTADGFGPVPGYADGNAATAEQTGWRPLLTTPNHRNIPPRAPRPHVGDGRGVQRVPQQTGSTLTSTGSTRPARPEPRRCASLRQPNDLRAEIIKPGCGRACATTSRASPESSSAKVAKYDLGTPSTQRLTVAKHSRGSGRDRSAPRPIQSCAGSIPAVSTHRRKSAPLRRGACGGFPAICVSIPAVAADAGEAGIGGERRST